MAKAGAMVDKKGRLVQVRQYFSGAPMDPRVKPEGDKRDCREGGGDDMVQRCFLEASPS
ncbi:hypothetical protein ACFPL7_04440 [Dongia soli]|uniref:Uncharacterized protein n=1 Tax=Dongia soli TaxID=600628 RepID=A0ABU5EII4_9PROT|nr:hypothetical protein [Dongia soli]MDY0885799.1 hypothetical protein [Dongia soli]